MPQSFLKKGKVNVLFYCNTLIIVPKNGWYKTKLFLLTYPQRGGGRGVSGHVCNSRFINVLIWDEVYEGENTSLKKTDSKEK